MQTPRELTQEEREWIDAWLPRLPMRVAREAVYEVLAGLIKPETLNRCDCVGDGPPIRYTIGRKVVYDTKVLLEWIVRRYGLKEHLNLDRLVANTGRRHSHAARKDVNARSAGSSGASCAA